MKLIRVGKTLVNPALVSCVEEFPEHTPTGEIDDYRQEKTAGTGRVGLSVFVYGLAAPIKLGPDDAARFLARFEVEPL